MLYGKQTEDDGSEKKVFKALYFSTKEMRQAFAGWPEIVFIDTTYKLLKRDLVVLIIAIRDANRTTQIVGVGLLANEQAATLKEVLKLFIADNDKTEACKQIMCFMTDKDLTERGVIRDLFPKASLYICEFHVLKVFSRTITTSAMKITTEQRDIVLDLLDRLTKSHSETEYDSLYRKLCETKLDLVISYFDKNWHSIRDEWTRYSLSNSNFGDYTNNSVETTNARLKSEIKPRSTFKDFCDGFFRYYNRRNEFIKYNAGQDIFKRYLRGYARGSDEDLYEKYLTTAAFKLVLTEYKRSNPMKFMETNDTLKVCWIRSGYAVLRCSTDICECNEYRSNKLPCRHIFATRRYFELPLFDRSLCSQRWTKEYNVAHQPMLQSLNGSLTKSPLEKSRLEKSLSKSLLIKTPSTKSVSTKSPSARSVPIQSPTVNQSSTTSAFFNMYEVQVPVATASSQIRKMFKQVCDNLNSHGNSASKNKCLSRLTLLKQIDYAWRNGIEVDLNEFSAKNIEARQKQNGTKDEELIDDQVISLPPSIKIAGRPKNITKCTVQSSNKKKNVQKNV